MSTGVARLDTLLLLTRRCTCSFARQVKLEWHKVANQKTRCLRITKKEEKGARGAMKRLRYVEL